MIHTNNIPAGHSLENIEANKTGRIGWVLFAAAFQTAISLYIFGKYGYAIASLGTALLVVILVGPVLQFKLSGTSRYGLFLVTIIFLNVDTFLESPGIDIPARLSLLMLALFLIYIALSFSSIFKTIAAHKFIWLFILFTFIQIGMSLSLGSDVFLAVFQRQVFYLFVFLAVVDFVLSSNEQARSLLYVIVLAGISAAVMLILEYLFSGQLGISGTALAGLRSGGLYQHAGHAAFVMAFCALVVSWLVFAGLLPRWSLLPASGLMLWSMVVTYSTQGVLSAVLIFIGIGIAFFTKRIAKSWVAILIIASLAIIITMIASNIFLGADFLQRFSLTRDNYIRLSTARQILSGDSSALLDAMDRSNRTEHLRLAWIDIQRQPWFGYGTGLSIAYPDKSDEEAISEFKPHNVFILVWLENGVFVLLMLLFMLLRIFQKNLTCKEADRWFRLLIIANLLIFMFARHILFFYRYLAVIFAIIYVMDKLTLTIKPAVNEKV